MSREIITVHFKSDNKHVSTLREKCLKATLMRVVHIVTTVLQQKKKCNYCVQFYRKMKKRSFSCPLSEGVWEVEV
jgi:hypothetical protein